MPDQKKVGDSAAARREERRRKLDAQALALKENAFHSERIFAALQFTLTGKRSDQAQDK